MPRGGPPGVVVADKGINAAVHSQKLYLAEARGSACKGDFGGIALGAKVGVQHDQVVLVPTEMPLQAAVPGAPEPPTPPGFVPGSNSTYKAMYPNLPKGVYKAPWL